MSMSLRVKRSNSIFKRLLRRFAPRNDTMGTFRNDRVIISLILFLCLLFSGTSWAGPGVGNYKNFQNIPVLDGGRLKPLDTFARSMLTRFSGHDHYGKQGAASWLASLFFNPGATLKDKIFLINSPDIAAALGIDPEPQRRYTPEQLQGSYQKLEQLQEAARKIPENQRSLVENEIIRVFDNISTYTDLNSSFKKSNSSNPQLVKFWEDMTHSYLRGDDVEFSVAAHSYSNAVCSLLSKDDLKKTNTFPLELLYQATGPFTWSIVLYILAFIFFVISFSSPKVIWYRLGLWSVLAGVLPHAWGLIARIIIMDRPPVASLYETFIFVGFIAVFLGLAIEFYNKQWLGIITAAIGGTAMLFIANKYSMEGDTMGMLVAVLNSNFWLATHVTTITMGYGAACVAGLLGHMWLLGAAFRRDTLVLDQTYKTTLGILGLALTMTFLGTNLGGIWADQSWGRFWGWDPKENGALMIVLWIAMLLHAKVSSLIGPRELAVGAVIGLMVVMWAWFGVNLLSVGLHSYGFTSGVATGLIVYAVCELIFLIVTIWRIYSLRGTT
ncbi:MAG: cytochrome c biogenesis protein CcsA [Candidatus Omnitrophica bacterium]|nr:cytochrome c biogenesis protein CcsA [Candidatus Omnitrophota bacterium]